MILSLTIVIAIKCKHKIAKLYIRSTITDTSTESSSNTDENILPYTHVCMSVRVDIRMCMLTMYSVAPESGRLANSSDQAYPCMSHIPGMYL